jgi:hypothetical protein
MIQRVQSIYLLLITVLMSFMLMRPYAELTITNDQTLIFQCHAVNIYTGDHVTGVYQTTTPVIALVLIIGLLSFGNIFFYNRRIVQMRICMVNMVLLLSLLIIILIYYNAAKMSLITNYASFRIPAIFPLMSIVFNIMAYRLIHRDELLVNSYNRIR